MNLPIILKFSSAPPTANNAFATIGRKRVMSKRYGDWRRNTGLEILFQRPGRITGVQRDGCRSEQVDGRRFVNSALGLARAHKKRHPPGGP